MLGDAQMPTNASPSPPVVLLDGPAELASFTPPPGWTGQVGFDLPPTPWDVAPARVLCVGTVRDAAAAAAAVEALSRGAGLAVVIEVTGAVRHRLIEDLHRIGAVTDDPTVPALRAGGLDDDHRALLDALAAGATVADAARRLGMSRRTANRRLSEARTVLGVAGNTEAVAAWADMGG